MTKGAFVQVFAEFFPILAFFVAGQLLAFIPAVIVLVVTTVLSLAVSLWYLGHLPLMPLASAGIVILAGGITVFFGVTDAIIFSDTIYFFTFAGLIAFGFWREHHFLERVFHATFAMTSAGWRILSWRWLILLSAAGLANEYVRIFLTPEFWIDYKFTKVILISLFAFMQFGVARRYRIPGVSNSWGLRTVEE